MQIYLDRRTLVTGQESNINAHNPFNLTKFVKENCCTPDRTNSIGGTLPGTFPPATPWNPIRIPRSMNGWELESIEIQTMQLDNSKKNDFQVTVGSYTTELIMDTENLVAFANTSYTVTDGELVSVELVSLNSINDLVLILNLKENV